MAATMAVVPTGAADWLAFSVIAGYFLGLNALYTDEQINTEKMRTTQYIPTQKRKG
jgi:hypothetical protein